MIVLFTDFGQAGPYNGQMRAVLAQTVPQEPVIDLMVDVPVHDVEAASHLLAAYHGEFPADTVFLCVVDPGVGSSAREPVVVHADGHWYVGPGNGLFDVVSARSARVEAWRITWNPKRLSASFHGRDLFAPVAAMIAGGAFPEAQRIEYSPSEDKGADVRRVIYVDHFGNLVSGIRAISVGESQILTFQGIQLVRAHTFSDVEHGQPLFYENSSGLLEIAVNCGRADHYFHASVGDEINLTLAGV